MIVPVNAAWLKCLATALLAFALCAPALAGEAVAPEAEDKAKKLLEQEAITQAKLKAEIRAEVEAHYEAGKRLYDNFDFEGAKRELEYAAKLDPENGKVRGLLIQVRDKFQHRDARIRSALQNVAEYLQAKTQADLVELDNRIDRGKKYMQEAKDDSHLSPAERKIKYENAMVEFEKAREIIKYLPVVVVTGEQEAEVKSLYNECEKAVAGLKQSVLQSAQSEAAAAAQKELDRRRRDDERKLNMALDAARTAFDTGRYSLAKEQAEKVLELDPGNPDASAIKIKTQDKFYETRKKDIDEEYREQFLLSRERADRYNIPHSDYLIYPDDWRQIAQRTSQETRRRAEEPWKEEIRKKMKRLVSFEFVDTPLVEALKFLNTLTKVTIILDPKAVAEGADKTPINLRVQDMPLELALKWVLKLAELEYDLRQQAVFITKKADAAATGELEIYDIRDLTTTITDFPGPRIDVGASASGQQVDPFQQTTPVTQLQDVDLASLIKDKILAAEFTDPQFTIDVSNGKLVVFQRPEVHERIRQLLRSFRETQTIQVLTQVRFVDVTDNFLENIGVSLTGLDSAPNEPGLANAAVDPLNQPSRYGLFPAGGGPGLAPPLPSDVQSSPAFQFQHFIPTPPFVNRAANAPILLLHPRLDSNFPNQGNPDTGPALAPAGFRKQWYSKIFGSPVLVQGLTQGILPANPLSSPLGQSIQSNPGQGALFQFRFLQALQTSAVLQAVRKDQTADQLLAPKLMQFNNQRAHVMVAQQRSYIKDYDVSGAVYDPVIGSFLTGVVLEVKPTVSNDKRYITLELHPGTAIELTPPIIVFITNSGNINSGTGTINLPIELPNLELRSISTTVTIPDNGTMLFSGLINDQKIDTKTGIPMLSDLPVVGRLFSTNSKERVRRNLLVLVNARIILFDEEEANISERSAPLPRYPKPAEAKVEKCRASCPCP
ncbi:MAG TPA: hypothetical protein VKX17_27865 [Planctomycetota bacterium]|nr:hypothetical protein [Planctomycetota bacterium]